MNKFSKCWSSNWLLCNLTSHTSPASKLDEKKLFALFSCLHNTKFLSAFVWKVVLHQQSLSALCCAHMQSFPDIFCRFRIRKNKHRFRFAVYPLTRRSINQCCTSSAWKYEKNQIPERRRTFASVLQVNLLIMPRFYLKAIFLGLERIETKELKQFEIMFILRISRQFNNKSKKRKGSIKLCKICR